MHSERLDHRHACDPVRSVRLSAGSNSRIAVDPCPQNVQVAQQAPQSLLSCAASQEYLVKNQERSMASHFCEALVPDLLDGPELRFHRNDSIGLEHEARSRIVSPTRQSLSKYVRAESKPQPRQDVLQRPGNRGLPRWSRRSAQSPES